mmetsp:Transcript_41117/g.128150  ORF Transcript_41117/g.128150 Transcript_41117/m.128150 type:complete len:376 (+) Transcript_41117:991-2118(+)
MALDDGAVGHHVGFDALAGHVAKKVRHAGHLTTPGASVHQGIEGSHREGRTSCDHLVVDDPDAIVLLLAGKALQHRAVNNGIHQGLGLRLGKHLMDQLVASLGVTVADKSLDHAANGHARRHDALGPHLPPDLPGAVEVAQEAVGAHDAAKAVRTLHHHAVCAALALELLRKEVFTPDAHAGLADRAQQDLVHCVLHGVHDRQSALDVPGPTSPLDVLQEDGASDVVGPQAACLHVVDEGPHTLAAQPNRCVDELIEGHGVRRQGTSSLAHLVEKRARTPEIAGLRKGLDHGVVGHDVGHARQGGLPHDAVRVINIPANDRRVDERVVEAGRLFGARLEGLCRSSEGGLVTTRAQGLDQRLLLRGFQRGHHPLDN